MGDNVVEATTKFNAEFKGSRTGTDADSVLQFFDDGFDDFGNVLGTDCSGAIYLLFKKAIIDIYGSSKFDAMYGASTIKFTGRTGAVAPGDWVVFRNTGDYGIKHNGGFDPLGEDNTICVAEEKYWGQGLPGTGKATAAEIDQFLVDAYNLNTNNVDGASVPASNNNQITSLNHTKGEGQATTRFINIPRLAQNSLNAQ